jgi:glycosyltransferase involved in cell wall biosynthesis
VAAVEESCEVAALTRASGSGVVVEPGHAGALAEAIRRFHDDRELAMQAGRAARALSARFDRRTQVARYADVLRQVTTGRAAVPATVPVARPR